MQNTMQTIWILSCFVAPWCNCTYYGVGFKVRGLGFRVGGLGFRI